MLVVNAGMGVVKSESSRSAGERVAAGNNVFGDCDGSHSESERTVVRERCDRVMRPLLARNDYLYERT